MPSQVASISERFIDFGKLAYWLSEKISNLMIIQNLILKMYKYLEHSSLICAN